MREDTIPHTHTHTHSILGVCACVCVCVRVCVGGGGGGGSTRARDQTRSESQFLKGKGLHMFASHLSHSTRHIVAMTTTVFSKGWDITVETKHCTYLKQNEAQSCTWIGVSKFKISALSLQEAPVCDYSQRFSPPVCRGIDAAMFGLGSSSLAALLWIVSRFLV